MLNAHGTEKRPEVSVKLILRSQGKVLMMKHTNGANDFPGGRIEWGESPEEALKREVMEELEYELSAVPRFINMWNYLSADKSRHTIYLYFLLDVPEEPILHSTENADLIWRTKEELDALIGDPPFVEKLFA